MIFQFEPLNLNKQQEYLNRLSVTPQKTSDYSFINLWGWAEEYGLYWSWKDELVWIRQTKPEIAYWAPVGSWESIRWETYLTEYFTGQNIFTRVPEQLVKSWTTSLNRIQVEEARGQWDYLYSVEELVELKGNRYHKKKNLLNQFLKTYHFTYTSLTPEIMNQALGMQNDWCVWRDCESSDMLASENRVIERILNEWNKLKGLIGGALMADNVMIAYTVAERLTDDTVLIHFEKGNPDYKGVYQAINQLFLDQVRHEFKLVNREQDMDDGGLRHAKLSYHPIDFQRKFKLTLI